MSRRLTNAAIALASVCALLALGTSEALAYTAYVGNYGSGSLTPINTELDAAGSDLLVNDPGAVAISPDAGTAWVTNYNEGTVTPVDLPTRALGAPIPVGPQPFAIAITPDGSRVYVANYNNDGPGTVTPVDARARAAGPAIPVGNGPQGIAINPDGRRAYVADHGSDTVTPIDLSTDTPGSAIAVGDRPDWVAITPDGSTVYVAVYGADLVTPIDVSTNQVGASFAVPDPSTIEISADGSRMYVGNFLTASVTPISLPSGTLGSPIPVGPEPWDIAITPDERTAYVSNYNASNPPGSVSAIDLAAGAPRTTIPVGTGPDWIAITPDQAPVARFSAKPRPAGTISTFDASASTVAYGSIGRYEWAFGDGTGVETSGPRIEHAYARPGAYEVTLTETSSAGTSTTRVFTGQTVMRNGGPSARATGTVQISKGPQLADTTLAMTRKGIVRVPVKCPRGNGTCAGRLKLQALIPRKRPTASRRARPRRLTVARTSFVVPPGKTRKLKVRLTRNGRRLVLRRRRQRCEVSISLPTGDGGNAITKTKVSLRAP